MVNLTLAGIRRPKSMDDPLFEEGNLMLALNRKFFTLADEVVQDLLEKPQLFSCSIAGCQGRFASNAAFELHYSNAHRHVCVTCRHILPTARLLELHILETHDSYFKALAERQKMVCLSCRFSI
jgi:hypothetical protein